MDKVLVTLDSGTTLTFTEDQEGIFQYDGDAKLLAIIAPYDKLFEETERLETGIVPTENPTEFLYAIKAKGQNFPLGTLHAVNSLSVLGINTMVWEMKKDGTHVDKGRVTEIKLVK